MSLSSLPDIFHKSATMSLRPQKQGGPFSLHLGQQHTEVFTPSSAGYAPGETTTSRAGSKQGRSSSMHSVRAK